METVVKGQNVLVWNTEREYAIFGQRIAATAIKEGCLAFVDYDRQVDGIVYSRRLLRNIVMTDYDGNYYTQPETVAQLQAVKFLQDNKEEILKVLSK